MTIIIIYTLLIYYLLNMYHRFFLYYFRDAYENKWLVKKSNY